MPVTLQTTAFVQSPSGDLELVLRFNPLKQKLMLTNNFQELDSSFMTSETAVNKTVSG